MVVELIGVLTFVTGLLVLYRGPDFGIFALMLACLLGAAAAVTLPALGGSNVQPAYAMLPFYLITVAMSRHGVSNAIRGISFPTPGFWFSAFVAYAVLATVFMPRLFEGAFEVFSISRSSLAQIGIASSPLAPRAGNVTQTAYLVGNLVLFATVVAHALNGKLPFIVWAVIVAAAANLAFAALDLITYSVGGTEYLEFIRNANYRMLADGDILGIKRIVGSFPEASTFAGRTLLYFAFCTELWLRGVFRHVTGLMALLSFAAILFSTSSSAYVALGIYCSLLFLRCAFSAASGRSSRRAFAIAVITPAGGLLLLLSLMLLPHIWSALSEFLGTTLLNKLDTQSGIERSLWNEQGLRVFLETGMLGAGVGSVRTSSWVVALLANTGLVGLILFIAFLASLAATALRSAAGCGETSAFAAAGAWSCFVGLIAAGLTAPDVNLNLVFIVCAAIACSPALVPLSERLSRHAHRSARRHLATRRLIRSVNGA